MRSNCFIRHDAILAQARYNFLMSRLRLKAEAGELDEEDLREINKVLLR